MKIKPKDRVAHQPTEMVRGESRYDYKSWGAAFKCPVCGQGCWKNTNFLGGKRLVCTGLKIELRLPTGPL
jgi:hypothetical protein